MTYCIVKSTWLNGKQVILLDDEDYERINSLGYKFKLCQDHSVKLNIKYYVYLRDPMDNHGPKQLLHRWLTNCPEDKVVDHINGNPLDNRRCNLRICTQKENSNNKNYKPLPTYEEQITKGIIVDHTTKINRRKLKSSGHKGIKWHASRNKWEAGINIGYKYIYVGVFNTVEEAVAARNAKLELLRG